MLFRSMKQFWEKWGHTIKIGAAAVLVLFVWASLRTDFATSLADRSQDVLKAQAKTIANLKGKAATEAGIKKYILENKKRAADLKTLASVANMNSALDVMKKVSDAAPPKGAVTLDVVSFHVQDSRVTMSGYVNSPSEVSLLQKSLSSVTTDGAVKAESARLSPLAGRTSFSFSFNVDRGVQKVTR